jgi:hypothetical protein
LPALTSGVWMRVVWPASRSPLLSASWEAILSFVHGIGVSEPQSSKQC